MEVDIRETENGDCNVGVHIANRQTGGHYVKRSLSLKKMKVRKAILEMIPSQITLEKKSR
jgi:hypothetical protein